MADFLWIAKLAAIVFILAYFKILSKSNSAIYATGVLALSIVRPAKADALPELVLIASTILFAGYLITYSILAQLKNISKNSLNISREMVKYAYVTPFLSMFVISAILSTASIRGWINLAVALPGLAAAGIVKDHAFKKIPALRKINSAFVAFTVLFFAAFLSRYDAALHAINVSLRYLALLSIYYLIKSTFTMPYKITRLKTGMLPAESIVKKGHSYTRSSTFFSVYATIQSRILNKCFEAKEIITPFNVLDAEAIDELRKAKLKGKIEDILIQKTIDFRVFIALGFIAVAFLSAR